MEDFAGGDVDDLRLVVSDEETEDTLQDVGQLLVLVRVLRDDATLLEIDVRNHEPLRRDEAPAQVRLELLLRQVLPAVQRCPGTVHDSLLSFAEGLVQATLLYWVTWQSRA